MRSAFDRYPTTDLRAAVAHYQARYGRSPRIVAAHPSQLPGLQRITTLPLLPMPGCLATELWLEQPTPEPAHAPA